MQSKLLEVAAQKSRIAISGHIRPDGDCVGSCLGTYHFLKNHYPKAEVVVYLEEIPHIFEFLQDWELIRRPGEEVAPYDLFITLDCGDKNRLGDSAKYFEAAKHTFCIDHHLSNKAFSDESIVVPDASSTCELVFQQIPEEELTKTIAECLYTGMVTDTGVFQYSSTHSSTMNAAGKLMDQGIDYPWIVDRVFNEKTFSQNRILGLALLKAKQNADKTVISCVITKQEMEEYGVLPKHMEGVVEQLRCTKDVVVSILLYETEEGTYKGSTRAKGHVVNLVPVVESYNGGGHKMAAGFSYTGDPEQCIQEITKKIETQLAQVE